MRFEVSFLTKNIIEKPHIPFSVLEHLKTNGIKFLADDGKIKDFCWAVKSFKKKRILSIIFSTYNKERGLEVLQASLQESEIFKPLDLKTLKEYPSKGTFKTISPLVLYDYQTKTYITEETNINTFMRAAKTNAVSVIKEVANIEIDKDEIEIEPIAFYTTKHYVYIPDKKGNIPVYGLNGMFEIKADEKILDIISKTGLGRRRSLGFGLIEPVK